RMLARRLFCESGSILSSFVAPRCFGWTEKKVSIAKIDHKVNNVRGAAAGARIRHRDAVRPNLAQQTRINYCSELRVAYKMRLQISRVEAHDGLRRELFPSKFQRHSRGALVRRSWRNCRQGGSHVRALLFIDGARNWICKLGIVTRVDDF